MEKSLFILKYLKTIRNCLKMQLRQRGEQKRKKTNINKSTKRRIRRNKYLIVRMKMKYPLTKMARWKQR